jgi:hypothetical protein
MELTVGTRARDGAARFHRRRTLAPAAIWSSCESAMLAFPHGLESESNKLTRWIEQLRVDAAGY